MARARWAQWPLCGFPWALKYPYCHQMITQTHSGGEEGFPKKSKCENSIAFGKSTSQRIYPKQHTPKIG